MVTVIYVSPDGTSRQLTAESNVSVMEAAVRNGLTGIVAECGGSLACATCHVYVDEAWLPKTGRAEDCADDLEDQMLEGTSEERRETSRLSCQLVLTEELDGLTVHLPKSQI
jgi:2Fe-2S ferredoxin